MSEGLKAMALEGHGIAFLPQNAVRKEVRTRALVSALPPEIDSLEATMEIRAYRARPIVAAGKPPRTGGRGGNRVDEAPAMAAAPGARAVDALWAYLVEAEPPAGTSTDF